MMLLLSTNQELMPVFAACRKCQQKSRNIRKRLAIVQCAYRLCTRTVFEYRSVGADNTNIALWLWWSNLCMPLSSPAVVWPLAPSLLTLKWSDWSYPPPYLHRCSYNPVGHIAHANNEHYLRMQSLQELTGDYYRKDILAGNISNYIKDGMFSFFAV